MWYERNYRRIFLDMHISDDREEYLSMVDPEHLVRLLREAGAQQIVVKCRPHTGLAYYPTKVGRMHRGLKGRDYVGEMTGLCHQYGIAAMAYFSQIFDNYAYDCHPDWRLVNGGGKTSRVDDAGRKVGRYGIVCPNNEEYRRYVEDCLTEIVSAYEFESIFLDMPFFPEVCYCASCRRKYHEETGLDLPRTVDWSDPVFREFQTIRERWLAEFTALSTGCVKSIRPEVTVEHNMAVLAMGWRSAATELMAEHSDYMGGDLYGGILQESIICKYYRNVSRALPFSYITSRCDPNLDYHTTTKTAEEFLLHGAVALAHNGALCICDGINPDGTLCESVYTGPVKQAFAASARYEKFAGGELQADVVVWLPSRAKYDRRENGLPVYQVGRENPSPEAFLAEKVGFCEIMRTFHIPFDVIPGKKLGDTGGKLLAVCNVASIRDEEMASIERHLLGGGSVYLSGHIGHPRLYQLLEMEHEGFTQQDVTYLNPTDAGKRFFAGFDAQSPLAAQCPQELVRLRGSCEVLATVTLPYTLTGTADFASIHSNPPGRHTGYPAMLLKKVGKGRILWSSAPLEASKPYLSRKVFANLIRFLCGTLCYTADAPGIVEIVSWVKNGRQYFAALNEQESVPYIPVGDITITLPRIVSAARMAASGEPLAIETTQGCSTIRLPKLTVFHMIEVE